MDNVVKVNVRIKSLKEVWAGDKTLLKSSRPDLLIDWNRELPTNEDAYAIVIAKGESWQRPAEPFCLEEASLGTILGPIRAELEHLWSERLEMPKIEILSSGRFLPRLNEMQRELNRQLGGDDVFFSPPTSFLSPAHGTILVPHKFLARVPQGRSYNTIELEWDRPFLEEVLCEELTHAIFRQLRGEWGDGYIRAMLSVGPEHESYISFLNEGLAQHVKEYIARRSRPRWGLYVIADKISGAWRLPQEMLGYRAADALSAAYSLPRIAMIDEASIKKNGLSAGLSIIFYKEHPYHATKLKKFEG